MWKKPDQRARSQVRVGNRPAYTIFSSDAPDRNPFLSCLLLFFLIFVLPGTAEAVSVTINVKGLDGDMLKSVLSGLTLEKQKDHPYLNDSLVRRLHDQAPEEIMKALEPFGFYGATVDPQLEVEGDKYSALYAVVKGNPVTVSDLDIRITGEGTESPQLLLQLEEFPLTKGAILVHRSYEQGKKALIFTAVQLGYLDARYLENRVHVKKEDVSAEIVLHLETGPRFSFGRVTLVQDLLSPAYLEDFVNINEGDPYEQKALLELQKAIYDSNQFSRVEVSAAREEADGLFVPVRVILEPGPARKFTAGVGYGTDTGPRFRTGWEHRRINRKVHRFRTDLLVSTVKTGLSGLYTIPLKRARTDHLNYSLAFERERVEDIDSRKTLLGLKHVRLRGFSQFSENLSYLWEDYDIATEEEQTALLYPGLGFNYVRADDRVNTRWGFRLDLELQGSQEGFFSQFSFLQARVKAKLITPLGHWGRVILRGERATTWIEDFEVLPASLRYFAGGDQSVRGFAYKSLSPLNAAGEAVGGRYLVVGSAEYEHNLSRSWSAAVFSDTGNSLESMEDPLESGAGVGVRWKSLIGLVRLDLAWALSREDKPWRIHLNIGPDL
ncbi:autotransporter assembly complex protein TamA [bacterium]|nr:autotransporter assembly complex protein TamA [bacterium]